MTCPSSESKINNSSKKLKLKIINQTNKQKPKISIQNLGWNLNRKFSKEKKQQRDIFEEGLSSLSIKETQIKRIPRLCPTPDIITKLNKAAESKYWGG